MTRDRRPVQYDLFGAPPAPTSRIAPEESRELTILLATLLLEVVRPQMTQEVGDEQDHA